MVLKMTSAASDAGSFVASKDYSWMPSDHGPGTADAVANVPEELVRGQSSSPEIPSIPAMGHLQRPAQHRMTTASTVVAAAWAIVVGSLAGSKDVVFDAALTSDEDTADPPDIIQRRISLPQGTQAVSEYLEATHQLLTDKNCSLPVDSDRGSISSSRSREKRGHLQTLLLIDSRVSGAAWADSAAQRRGWFDRYGLVLHVHLGEDRVRAAAEFDSKAVESWVVDSLLQRHEHVLRQLDGSHAESLAVEVQAVTPQDLSQIWHWNMTVPPAVDKTVYDIIAEQVRARPQAQAIYAWDGHLTYAELDQLVVRLANKLVVDFGVGPGVLVPLLFNKSVWVTVAMLGVVKAGGGFVFFDPSLPEQRLEAIVKQVEASLILSSLSNQQLGSRLARRTLVVGPDLQAQQHTDMPPTHGPDPSSIVWAVFTSGSTGKPKGVLISHSNAASALHYQTGLLGLNTTSRLFDFASYSFDGSINNALTVLAAGGCLCVPSEEDRKNRLEHSIVSLRANFLDLTPSVAQLLSPERLPGVHTIVFAGEALRVADAKQWWGKVRIINGYGPSECTPTSTINPSPSTPQEATHIGKGAGLVTWVVDPEDHDRLVPPGCPGELLLEGPLVGCGYLDEAAKTAAVFIEDPEWLLNAGPGWPGRHGRLYKTGDLVRYSHDGSLVYLGRKDSQVKIRGQRVELLEIEHLLCAHPKVESGVVVLQNDARQEPWIAGFVTLRNGQEAVEGERDNGEAQHVEAWAMHFDGEAYTHIESLRPNVIGRDFVGWTSMYDGSVINKAEMNEWLDDAVAAMLNGGPAKHVLEVGTGSGMILFNLAPHGLESYVGIEPSKRAVEFVSKTANTVPSLMGRIKMHEATVADLDLLDASCSPNLVVLNSVIQYFPTQDYLFGVLQHIVGLQGIETIFVGDVRSFPLHRQFLATKALRMAGEKADKDHVRRVMAQLEEAESELLVDPAFFTSLPSRLPDHVQHVEILCKKMAANNELSCYRYAAVLHIKAQRDVQLQIRDVGDDWIDFERQGLDRQSLWALLQRPAASPVIGVSNIPHGKTIFERHVVDAVDGRTEAERDHGGWLDTVRSDAQRCPSLSAVDLVGLAKQAGYRVEISWARQYSQRGGLDAVFYLETPVNSDRRALFRFPVDHQDRPYSSQPSRQRPRQMAQAQAQAQKELLDMLGTKLPTYMLPRTLVVLTEMPLNKNGKIDRPALAARVEAPAETGDKPLRRPASRREKQLQRVWERVLNMQPGTLGLDDDFFQLGGDSIAAMRVVGEARKVGLRLAVTDIFRRPALVDVAQQSEAFDDDEEDEDEVAPFALLDPGVDVAALVRDLSAYAGVDPASVRDAYPCTPLQEGLMSLALKKPGSYLVQEVYELAPDAVVEHLCHAWEQTARDHPILRTRLMQHAGVGLVQAVLDNPIDWIDATGLEGYLRADRQQPMQLGSPLTRFALVRTADADKPRWLVWTIHHALCDGLSMQIITDAAARAMSGRRVDAGPQFQAFIRYLRAQDDRDMLRYWRNALDNCESPVFPPLPPSVDEPLASETVRHEFALTRPTGRLQAVTTSTLTRAAWAIVAQGMTSVDQVVFGAIVSGRNAPVPGIEAMAAPAFATVPVRVRPVGDQTVLAYLEAVQLQATDMVPFEQVGLRRIAAASPHCRKACDFQTLLVVQPNEVSSSHAPHELLGTRQVRNTLQHFNTYALMLEVRQLAHGLVVSASFDPRALEPSMAHALLERLEFVMRQLSSSAAETSTVADIEVMTPQDLQRLWQWNSAVPTTVRQCAHDIVQARAASQPDAPALCAWDGNLSYRELDQLATQLAHQLAGRLLRPGTLVPLCFEKSMWTPVAMLGVLKAGAGFALLDPSLPEKRLQALVRQLDASLVLCSSQNQALSSRLSKTAMVVGATSLDSSDGNSTSSPVLDTHVSSNPMFAVFTSGSTGEPKCAVISHENFCSGLEHQSDYFRFSSDSRIFDFASYAFDVAVHNVFATLTSGGCLCTASEKDCRDNVAKAMADMAVNTVELTPTVARLIDPATVPQLHTLMLGGEAVSVADVTRWWGKVRILNIYGPAECLASTIHADPSSPKEVSLIGKGAGSVTWVADPDNHDSLLPPGCIGELILEGPLVGLGYLNDAKRTAAAFIDNPKWLLQGAPGQPGRRGRVYKTGDLVRYQHDGNLAFLGRKDSQVKIRGQRLELGEVEHWVQALMPAAVQVIAEVIEPQGGDSGPLLAVFVHKDGFEDTAPNGPRSTCGIAEMTAIPTDVEDKLAQHLPSYMVPNIAILMGRLPMSATGKTDRKRLRDIGASFSILQVANVRAGGLVTKRQPTSEVELQLQRIWSQVLNLDQAIIGLDDSFFKLGGDSISAMLASSAACASSIKIRPVDIVQEKTIANLAKRLGSVANTPVRHLPSETPLAGSKGPFPLSPMQRLYVELQPDPYICFDQCSLLKVKRGNITGASLTRALETIVGRHDALLSRFGKNKHGAWEQRTTAGTAASFSLCTTHETGDSETANVIAQCRQRLDLKNGPLLAAVLFGGTTSQKLFLTAHQMVVDLVSWRVLLLELEQLLTVGAVNTPRPMSFQDWVSLQAQYVAQHMDPPATAPMQPETPLLAYWGMESKANLQRHVLVKRHVMDESRTSVVLGSFSDVHMTRLRPVDLMLAALVHSFQAVFADRPPPAVLSEGHGREPWNDDIDVTTTVGCFTTLWPAQVLVANEKTSPPDNVRRTNERTRNLQCNGWSWFTSHFTDEGKVKALASQFPFEIAFNYEGQYQQLEHRDALFEELPTPDESLPISSLEILRLALIEVEARVERGRMVTSVAFHRDMHHRPRILEWIEKYEQTLVQMATDIAISSGLSTQAAPQALSTVTSSPSSRSASTESSSIDLTPKIEQTSL